MEKINVAELLKDCPKGMELDCYLFDRLEFDHIDTDNENYPIVCRVKTVNGEYNKHTFTKYGWYSASFDYSKCVIFPKGKTTWEGFVPPCQFKDGDIVYIKTRGYNQNEFIIIFKEIKNDHIYRYISFSHQTLYTIKDAVCHLINVEEIRLATEEEKAKLFKSIRDNGYKWNSETNTLKTLKKLVEPKFKVGDKIRHKCPEFRGERIIKNCNDTGYLTTINDWIGYKNQDDWELVPNKFDINTLKPFDKVLVRDRDIEEWSISLFSHCNSLEIYKYSCINGSGYAQCIPYQGNEHLLGKTDNCDEYFKTWK